MRQQPLDFLIDWETFFLSHRINNTLLPFVEVIAIFNCCISNNAWLKIYYEVHGYSRGMCSRTRNNKFGSEN